MQAPAATRPSAITARRPGRAARPLHVAVVDEELPYPPTSGKRIRTLNLLQRLAVRHRLTYICHRNVDRDEARQAERYLAAQGIASVVVDRAVPAKSGPLFYARLAANLFSSLPFTVATHDSRALRRAIRAHAAKEPVDLWHCEWTPYARALRAVPGRRVVVAHNVESTIWQRYHETERNPLRRWYIARQWEKFIRFERQALAAADYTVAVSDVDADRLQRELGVPRVAVVENGVDTRHFRPTDGRRDPARLLFLGSLDWRPNLDAVRQLLDHVFPAVRAAEPTASLWLVGRNPPGWLRAEEASRPGVTVHADVPDVRPFLDPCGLMVVPLRIGGGSRLKILEALAAGLPVVTTAIGAEGLHLEAGRHLSVVDHMDDLGAAVLAGIREPNRLRSEAAAGRRRVLERYDWDTLAEQMDQIWISCVDEALPGQWDPSWKRCA
jgi:glycosyltransferase involved in cell wall biosynthesis